MAPTNLAGAMPTLFYSAITVTAKVQSETESKVKRQRKHPQRTQDSAMGKVISLDSYRSQKFGNSFDQYIEPINDSLVPVEFAVAYPNRDTCLEKIQEYGIRNITAHQVTDQPQTVLHLIGVRDAIWLNKKILECEDLSDSETSQRIDLIQTLENANLGFMDGLWRSFTQEAPSQA